LKFWASETMPNHFSVNRQTTISDEGWNHWVCFLPNYFSGPNFTSAHKSWSDQYEPMAHTFWHLHLNHFYFFCYGKSIFKTGAKYIFPSQNSAHRKSYFFLSCITDTYYFHPRKSQIWFLPRKVQ
jgi:hypothetical protein